MLANAGILAQLASSFVYTHPGLSSRHGSGLTTSIRTRALCFKSALTIRTILSFIIAALLFVLKKPSAIYKLHIMTCLYAVKHLSGKHMSDGLTANTALWVE